MIATFSNRKVRARGNTGTMKFLLGDDCYISVNTKFHLFTYFSLLDGKCSLSDVVDVSRVVTCGEFNENL